MSNGYAVLCVDCAVCSSSVPWYDAKLWQFVLQHGEEGDFIWNVARVPEDVEEAAAEALHRVEQGPPA